MSSPRTFFVDPLAALECCPSGVCLDVRFAGLAVTPGMSPVSAQQATWVLQEVTSLAFNGSKTQSPGSSLTEVRL